MSLRTCQGLLFGMFCRYLETTIQTTASCLNDCVLLADLKPRFMNFVHKGRVIRNQFNKVSRKIMEMFGNHSLACSVY